MGRASRLKKLKRQPTLAPEVTGKVERDIRRTMGIALDKSGKEYFIKEFREWPCSMSNGKALLPSHIVPYKKEDGKLYFKAEDKEIMVVCTNYMLKQQMIEVKKIVEKNNEIQDSVSALKPVQLGE